MTSIRARITTPQPLGVILVILALISAFQMAYFSWDNRTTTNCQTRYNLALGEALRDRARYAEQDRQNNVTFVRERSKADTPEEVKAALDKYLNTQDRIERARQKEPLPHLPPGRCS